MDREWTRANPYETFKYYIAKEVTGVVRDERPYQLYCLIPTDDRRTATLSDEGAIQRRNPIAR